MAEMDMGLSPQNNKNNNGKKRKKKKKQNLFMSIVTGLIPWKGDSVTEVFRKIIFLASLIILVVAVVLILNHVLLITSDPNQVTVSNPDASQGETADSPTYIVDLKNQTPTQEQLEQLPEGTVNEEYAALYEANNDFVGWITIDGTNINYPVLQSGDISTFEPCLSKTRYGICEFCDQIEANPELAKQFYLHHDYNRYYLFDGNIFADFDGKFTPDSMPNNTILYGHNMLYKHQFSALTNYNNNINFLKASPVIDFNTMYKNNKYKIFSVFITNVSEELGEVFDYYNYVDYDNSSEFYNYILECMDRSIYETGVDIKYGDEILTLSTCDASTGFQEDMRLIVVARKVRENENPTVDTSKIVRKTSVKYFDAYYAAYGNKWKGRTWDVSLVQGMAEYLKENGLEDPAE
ncbi:MAG: class B sortase [Oscillospiraceae bacterium]|nr:class B sortase [Oscillospiraceae bacterium]